MPYRFRRYPIAGMTAGAIGGLIGEWVTLGWEVTRLPRPATNLSDCLMIFSAFMPVPAHVAFSYAIHFVLSMLMGAVYGALVEYFPIAAIGTGVGFGLAVWIGAHELLMPVMRLTPPPWKLPIAEQGYQFFGHALWGFVIGVFTHDLRARFVKPNLATMPQAQQFIAPVPESVEIYAK